MEVSKLMAYELGWLDSVETAELFADLISSGMAWKLQGHYGRTAMLFIATKIISNEGVIDYNRLHEEIY
jgi:hypothetical protein